MKCVSGLVLLFLLQAVFIIVHASDEIVHQELTQFKETILKALNKNKFKDVLPLLHPDIVLTAENNRVARKREGVEKFYDSLLGPENGQLEKFSIDDFAVDELSIIHNENTAIAFGGAIYSCFFKSGEEYTYPVRWTATLVLQDGRWTLAAIHSSVNFTDNIVIDTVRKSLNVYIFGAFLAGIGAGYLLVTKKIIK